MTARKPWTDLAVPARNRRIASMGLPHRIMSAAALAPVLDNHLPRTDRTFGTMAALHRHCANGAACTGPGCRRQR